ncbi:MAG TPA: LysR family transcriptional regulator [Opitutaceae bacterium]|jgi:DNA-binding transcriptional LysR family regulator|nr:LysR family transcriptional regulator [Opitutaceae bacterium]
MNRNHLALFHAVAQAGSISGAAASVHVSQPAVSRQIGELESALGVRLLDRLPRGCRLTEAGAILAGLASRWRAVENEAARAMEEYRGLKRGRLTVGASMTIGGYLLPGMLAAFHRRCPQIDLQVEIGNTSRIHQALVDGAVDAGLTEGPLQAEDVESAPFFQDELVPIAPPGHPLLRKGGVTARELCREPILLREEGSGTRAVVERALRRRGIAVQPLLALASPEAIKNAVAAGLGVAFVSRLVIEAEVRAGTLGIISVRDLSIRRPLHLRRARGRSVSPSLAIFLEILGALKAPRLRDHNPRRKTGASEASAAPA